MIAAASLRRPWLRVAALLGAGALVALELLLRRRRRGAPRLPPGGAARAPPAGLLRALGRRECVAALGPEFLAPALPGSSLRGLLAEVVREALASPGPGGREPLEAAAAAAVLARLSAEDLPPSDAELLVGDACAAVGRRRLWRGAAAVQRRWRAGRALSRRARAAVADCLDAVEAAPFAAILASSWSPEMQERFPCGVGRNFGGFATVLMKPNVDRPPARSRPVLHLWPGLLAAASGGARGGAEALPASPEDGRGALVPDSPYLAFLSDLLLSKTVLLVGWVRLPPEGHFGEALRQAWRKARARDPSRQDPLAYALAPVGAAGAGCLEECGLEVLTYEPDPTRVASAIGASLRGLAEACGAGEARGPLAA